MTSGVTIVGAGTVIFSNANTYQGSTYVNSGTLQIANAKALGGYANNGKLQNEIQRFTYFDPSSAAGLDNGQFTLAYNGNATPLESLATVTAASLQADLRSLPGLTGNVAVTEQTVTTPLAGTPTPTLTEYIFTIIFQVALAGVDVPQLVASTIGGAFGVVSSVADGGVGARVNTGAALALNLPSTGATVTGVALQLNGSGPTGNGALENVAGNASWQGVNLVAGNGKLVPAITLSSASTIGVDGSSTLTVKAANGDASGVSGIDGVATLPLSKLGTGTLLLPTANHYAGTTQIQNGVVGISNNHALGQALSNETQTVTINGSTNGTFQLTFNGQTTPAMSADYTNGTTTLNELQTQLQLLSTIGTGNVTVTQSANVFTITFVGALQGQSQNLLGWSATSGTAIQVAETQPGGLGYTVVTNGVTVAFQGTLGDASQPMLTANTSNLTGTAPGIAVAATTLGNATTNAVQTLNFNGTITGGTFTLTYLDSLGNPLTTKAITWSSNYTTLIANIQQALDKLVGAGNTLVSLGNGGTLDLQAGLTFNSGEPAVLAGSGYNPGTGSLGALESTPTASNQANTWSNPVVLQSHSTIGVDPVSGTASAPGFIGLVLMPPTTGPIAQSISGPAGFTKINAGVLELTGAISNTYGGTTDVTDGLVELTMTGGAVAIPGPLVVGDSTSNLAPIVQLEGDNQIAWTGNQPVTINADGLLDLNGHTQTLAQLNIVDGLVHADLGSTVSGTLNLTQNATLGATVLTMVGGELNLDTGGVLTLNGNVQATADPTQATLAAQIATIISTPNLQGKPTGVFNVGNSIFTVNFPTTTPPTTAATDGVDLDVRVPLTAAAGNPVTKNGPGRLELDADNSATLLAPLVVNAGPVQVDGIVNEVSLNSTGTVGSVGGTGTVGTIDGGAGMPPIGTINPGDNGLSRAGSAATKYGILNAGTGATITWGNATTYAVDLSNIGGNLTPGMDYDQLAVNGNINLGGANLSGSVDPTVLIPDPFTILTATGNITGRFAEPYGEESNGEGIDYIAGQKFDVQYNAHSVVLTRAQDTVTEFTITSPLHNGQSIYGQDCAVLRQRDPRQRFRDRAGERLGRVHGHLRHDHDRQPAGVLHQQHADVRPAASPWHGDPGRVVHGDDDAHPRPEHRRSGDGHLHVRLDRFQRQHQHQRIAGDNHHAVGRAGNRDGDRDRGPAAGRSGPRHTGAGRHRHLHHRRQQ